MGESRQELLAWLNNLLQLNVTKVEQCGSGAALCQIFDSIFMDVPMSRVKFNVNNEYGYLQNFKILQNTFTKHQIDRTVPVEGLVKCKMQDNLEFLQWTKRYWDQYFPGVEYDPIARRKGAGAPAPAVAVAPTSTATSRTATARRPAAQPAPAAAPAARAPRTVSTNGTNGTSAGSTAALTRQLNEAQESVAGLERERDFYFNKLRDIEVLLQQEVEVRPELEQDPEGLVARLQAILYSTEEGFEIPAEQEEGEEGVAGAVEEETF